MRNELRKIAHDPLFMALYLPGVLIDLCRGLLDPVLPLYARGMASYGLVGVALAAEGFGTLLFDLPSGLIAGRMGRKRSMLLGLVGSAAACVALFWTDSIIQVIACRLVYGAFRSIYMVSAHVYATDHIALDNRGRSLSLLGGMRRIGNNLAGPMIGGAVAASLGLRVPFLLVAVVSAAAIALVLLFVQEEPAAASRQAPVAASPRARVSYSGSQYRVWAAAGFAQMLGQMIRTAPRSIIPLYAADVLGLDVGAVGSIMGISAILDVAVFYLSGVVMDR